MGPKGGCPLGVVRVAPGASANGYSIYLRGLNSSSTCFKLNDTCALLSFDDLMNLKNGSGAY
jgi:hypothetical protein